MLTCIKQLHILSDDMKEFLHHSYHSNIGTFEGSNAIIYSSNSLINDGMYTDIFAHVSEKSLANIKSILDHIFDSN